MDTLLSCLSNGLALEVSRGQIPQRRVQPLPIVEDFDEVEHLPARPLARGPAPVMDELALERAEETLAGCPPE